MSKDLCIFWFRRDLRLEDNAGLYQALKSGMQVLPLFIFDTEILDKLSDRKDKRVQFIYQEVMQIKARLESQWGSSMIIRHGNPKEIWSELVEQYQPQMVVANRDYEPYAIQRDQYLYNFLDEHGIPFKAYKDHVLLDRREVLKKDGDPYTVFTPYYRQHQKTIKQADLESFRSENELSALKPSEALPEISLQEMGFESEKFDYPSREVSDELIANYDRTRDYPGQKGTSRLSLHLRFGTISIRSLARKARSLNETFYKELIWRDFYQAIIYHFPHSADGSFRPQYDHIPWRNNEAEFQRWCNGRTGYPLVDAAMRELNHSGFMHNRMRMLVASFLTKHLLIDWRWGEAYFAEKLLDYECASNVGGWQWAAGSGVDAQPYFRVFNPELQLKKFDPERAYIKKWVPEIDSDSYPEPMVDHKAARQRAIDTFKQALS